MPLALHLLETPNLIRRPPISNALRQRLHVLPLHIVIPRLQEVVVVDILQLDPAAPALDLSEDLVLVLAPRVVEGAVLIRAADAAGGYLCDVDVRALVGGFVDVLRYGEGDGRVGDGFAQEPGYALLGWGVRWGGGCGGGGGGWLPFRGYGRSRPRGICSE